ncbi:unnamed protein product [Adineta steineri]|uniref:Ig-like domain-containing protein n=1 Tax=Adineta steineri TaxID=433720 RepID=A0A814YHW8_9BILA|nr:unnamed protein product [Adineta steineri]CAF3725844.1 unnamed protein product [Adineta steineri]
MTVQLLLIIFSITITSIGGTSHIWNMNEEIDSSVSFRCEIDELNPNAVITWVYRPKIYKIKGVKWLPLYANARRLTQDNHRYIVDYSGYNEKTKKYLSILSINQLKLSDEGIYMCKSNQYQSIASLFNLTISPSMKILPNDGIIELNRVQRSINLSCIVREVSMNTIDPLHLKWYHNNHEIKNSHSIEKLFKHENQATLHLYIRHLSFNDSGLFKCVYDNGKASKNVQIFYTSSGK